jgi:hypothetical protein
MLDLAHKAIIGQSEQQPRPYTGSDALPTLPRPHLYARADTWHYSSLPVPQTRTSCSPTKSPSKVHDPRPLELCNRIPHLQFAIPQTPSILTRLQSFPHSFPYCPIKELKISPIRSLWYSALSYYKTPKTTKQCKKGYYSHRGILTPAKSPGTLRLLAMRMTPKANRHLRILSATPLSWTRH